MTSSHFSELDEIVHGPVRLGTLAYLSTAGSIELQELKRRLGVTDGNLATHIRKLEKATYIVVEKRGAGRASVTRITLTAAGRKAFSQYCETLNALLRDVRDAG
jgi:DNA-binding MarR family transcriptional regulator